MAADGIFLGTPAAVGAGTRLAVKDLLDTADLTTTYGSAIFAEHVPATSAASVLLAEAAGYANVGKTNLHEFAYGTTSENAHFGTVPNPLAEGRIAGGSSGGSAAALAVGLADAGLGSDSAGSMPIPAGCCGGGRLQQDSGGLLRGRRVQAELRARPDRRLLPAGAELRPCRSHGSRSGRLQTNDGGARPRPRARGRAAVRSWGRRRLARRGGAARSGPGRGSGREIPEP